jgi:predicted secreted Zn-dependent protease
MNSVSVLAALGAVLIAGALGAAIIFGGAGDMAGQPTAQSSTSTVTAPDVAPTSTPAFPTPRPSVTPPPDRTDCLQIKGTPYRSDTERAFYLANCTGTQAPAPTAPSIGADTTAACSTDISVTSQRTDKTFDVSGTTVDSINASLQANGPVVGGEVAAGLTQYQYGIDGSFCTRAGSCKLGAMTIATDITVTLPNLTTLSQVSSEIKTLWASFAEAVKVHENRHVTILVEGLEEIKRQLLIVAEQPDCDTLNHELDRVWRLYSSQMEQRQNAFHAADSIGQGGSVVR